MYHNVNTHDISIYFSCQKQVYNYSCWSNHPIYPEARVCPVLQRTSPPRPPRQGWRSDSPGAGRPPRRDPWADRDTRDTSLVMSLLMAGIYGWASDHSFVCVQIVAHVYIYVYQTTWHSTHDFLEATSGLRCPQERASDWGEDDEGFRYLQWTGRKVKAGNPFPVILVLSPKSEVPLCSPGNWGSEYNNPWSSRPLTRNMSRTPKTWV